MNKTGKTFWKEPKAATSKNCSYVIGRQVLDDQNNEEEIKNMLGFMLFTIWPCRVQDYNDGLTPCRRIHLSKKTVAEVLINTGVFVIHSLFKCTKQPTTRHTTDTAKQNIGITIFVSHNVPKHRTIMQHFQHPDGFLFGEECRTQFTYLVQYIGHTGDLTASRPQYMPPGGRGQWCAVS